MREQLIAFETSKLAKDKGFDLHAFQDCYNSHGYTYGNGWCERLDDFFEDGTFSNSEMESKGLIDYYTAPTQSLLQKWLREEHDLDVNVMCLRYKRYFYKIFKHDVKLIQLNDVVISYPTYEEALEEGLQEALKLIKLKEDGNNND